MTTSDLPTDVEKYTAEYEAKIASAKSRHGVIDRPEVFFKKGARFFKDEATGVTMFGFRSSANADYVAKADERHREDHPKEWLDYVRSQKGVKKP